MKPPHVLRISGICFLLAIYFSSLPGCKDGDGSKDSSAISEPAPQEQNAEEKDPGVEIPKPTYNVFTNYVRSIKSGDQITYKRIGHVRQDFNDWTSGTEVKEWDIDQIVKFSIFSTTVNNPTTDNNVMLLSKTYYQSSDESFIATESEYLTFLSDSGLLLHGYKDNNWIDAGNPITLYPSPLISGANLAVTYTIDSIFDSGWRKGLQVYEYAFSVGETEFVETDIGKFEAFKVSAKFDDGRTGVRTLWIYPDIGVVRMYEDYYQKFQTSTEQWVKATYTLSETNIVFE